MGTGNDKGGKDDESAIGEDELFPIAADARRHAEEEARYLASLKPGMMVPGRGVYLGVWKPEDRYGKSLGKVFNVFAAPHDLGLDDQGKGRKLMVTFNNAQGALEGAPRLLGHKGACYDADTDLYEALRNGAYDGSWFVPPLELVCGRSPNGRYVQPDNLYRHRGNGAFAGTFESTIIADAPGGPEEAPASYWSFSRDISRNAAGEEMPNFMMHFARFTDGRPDYSGMRFINRKFCRLVRVEEAPQL